MAVVEAFWVAGTVEQRQKGWEVRGFIHSPIHSFNKCLSCDSEGLGETAVNTRPFHVSWSSIVWQGRQTSTQITSVIPEGVPRRCEEGDQAEGPDLGGALGGLPVVTSMLRLGE